MNNCCCWNVPTSGEWLCQFRANTELHFAPLGTEWTSSIFWDIPIYLYPFFSFFFFFFSSFLSFLRFLFLIPYVFSSFSQPISSIYPIPHRSTPPCGRKKVCGLPHTLWRWLNARKHGGTNFYRKILNILLL